MNQTSPLQTAYSEWNLLKNRKWTHYLTFTFPTDCSKERANRLWRQFTFKAAKEVLNAREARKGFPWVASFEKHQLGSCHIHALIQLDLNVEQIKTFWLNVAGSKIVDVRMYTGGNALAYVVKGQDITLHLP